MQRDNNKKSNQMDVGYCCQNGWLQTVDECRNGCDDPRVTPDDDILPGIIL